MWLSFRQFLLLIWKGAILRKRHWIITILEIIIPLALVVFFVWLRTQVEIGKHSSQRPPTYFAPFDPLSNRKIHKDVAFFFTPNNNKTIELTNSTIFKLIGRELEMAPIGLDSEDRMEKEAEIWSRNNSYSPIFGVVYENLQSDDEEWPNSLHYTIRTSHDFKTTLKYPAFASGGPSYADGDYFKTGFIGLQAALDQVFIERKLETEAQMKDFSILKLLVQRFPFPSYYDQTNLLNFIDLMPMMIIYGYSIMATVFVKRIVDEKANRAKEMMRMMGLSDMVYFGGTFSNTFIVMGGILSLTAGLFKVPVKGGLGVIGYSDGSLAWILFLLYAVNSLIFCMALSTIFEKPVVSAIVTFIVWSASYTLPRFLMDPLGVPNKYTTLSLAAKMSSCLLPNAALHWACRAMAFYEGTGEGIGWRNWSEPSPGDDFSLAMVMGMMVASCGIYSFILWYLDNIWPWQFSIPKHPLFFFMRSYWCPRRTQFFGYDGPQEDVDVDAAAQSYFEEDPRDKQAGISISRLTKVFGWGRNRKMAVNKLSLNMYKGQITALLGHNGAGKTTTINVITGLYSPTSGTAVINGCDIMDNLKGARQSLGLCPQHNVLYENLTVEEHLIFFAGLKGHSFTDTRTEIESCLDLLQLQKKRQDFAKNLSGGMKRKLSLGIAMIGKSEVLILDEPTSGMDPQARRAIWDLLQRIREKRTIILTTHYMEEADILGDRIAIMAEGTVQCCGSPLFLKRKFGAGYHLRVSKGNSFNLCLMTDMIKASIPTAYVETDIRTEVGYVLPITDSGPFVNMFQDLEKSKLEIGYTSCGLSITTMEDVFIKVGLISEKAVDENLFDWDIQSYFPGFQTKTESRLRGLPLFLQQVRGLLTKRFHFAKRYWVFLIFLVFLPLAIIFLMLYVRNAVDIKRTDITPLKLNLGDTFGQTDAFISRNDSDGKMDPFINGFQAVLREYSATPTIVANVSKKVLEVGEDSLQTYMTKLLVGGIFNEEGESMTLTAMYSGQAYHVSAMALNLMDATILRKVTGDLSANIKVTNAPFPIKSKDPVDVSDIPELSTRLIFNFFLPLALSFLSASFVLFPIHERTTKSKLIQLMTGVNGVTFWVTHFLWDFVLHFISSCFMLIPFVVMDIKNVYSNGTDSIGTLFLMLVLYGWSSIPLTYLLSFISKTSSTGFSFACAVNFITGMILTVSLTVFKLVKTLERKDTSGADFAAWAFRVLPNFAMTWGTANLDAAGSYNQQCHNLEQSVLNQICRQLPGTAALQVCCKDICGQHCFKEKTFFSTEPEACGNDMIFMFATGFIFFGLLVAIETNWMRFWYRFWDGRNKEKTGLAQEVFTLFGSGQSQGEDADVGQERTRVENLFQQGLWREEALAVLGLRKKFGKIDAVDRLTFSIHKDECFGLLGVNGAGKTTTFSMLTGDLAIGEGNAKIGNSSVKDHLKKFQWHVGYCPQFDAILDRMSGREALFLFARLRGVPESEIPSTVDNLIHVVDLQTHADKTADTYSGGNRRKLSLAMSLVGSPPVVFLDEPTAGVDPASRRKIWTALSRVQATGGTSFILTTHSMEECEALCGRLAIMVNGQFRCLGGIQYLKSKFGQGYTIIVKLNKEQHLDQIAIEAVKQSIQKTFPDSFLKNEHQGMLHYHIVDASLSWSYLFREMERIKSTFDLEDYLISDTTLEQIFLAFARTQRIISSP